MLTSSLIQSFAALLVSAILLNLPTQSKAFLYDLAGGPQAVSDVESALKRTLERAHFVGSVLISEGNRAAEQRLDQIDLIVNDALDKLSRISSKSLGELDAIIDSALRSAFALEAQLIIDARQLAECTIEVAGDEISRSIIDTLIDIAQREPTISIPVLSDGTFDFDTKPVPAPIEAWEAMMVAFMDELSEIDETSSLSRLTNIYDEIERQSRQVRCHYREDGAAYVRASREMLEAARRSSSLVPYL